MSDHEIVKSDAADALLRRPGPPKVRLTLHLDAQISREFRLRAKRNGRTLGSEFERLLADAERLPDLKLTTPGGDPYGRPGSF